MIAFDMDFPFREDGKVEVSYEMDFGEIGEYRVLLYPDMKDITNELSATEELSVRDAIHTDYDENDDGQ